MRSSKLLLSLLGASFALSALAQPGPSRVDSMELRVAQSDLIVRGTVSKLEPAKGEDWEPWFWVSFRTEETLKGTAPRELRFLMRSIKNVGKLQEWTEKKTPMMVFLAESKHLAAMGTVFRSTEQKKEWLFTREPFAPVGGYDENSIISLDSPEGLMQSYSYSLQPLVKAQDLLVAAKLAVQFEPQNIRSTTVTVRVDPSTYEGLNLAPRGLTGMGLGVSFPLDSRLESAAQMWLKSPLALHRLSGVESLVYFRTGENAAAIRPLLADADPAVVTAAKMVLDVWGMSDSR